MVDPECRARAPSGAARFHWSFTVLGQPDPVTTGAGELAEARALAEMALGVYAAGWRAPSAAGLIGDG
jgi:hypothetical protein